MPSRLERELKELEEVEDVAVVGIDRGVPDEKAPSIFIVPSSAATIDRAMIHSYVKGAEKREMHIQKQRELTCQRKWKCSSDCLGSRTARCGGWIW